MIVDAFVLPYPGRSVGVVFWAARTEPRQVGGAPTANELAVYAPGDLSPGDLAELQAHYTASLGDAIRVAGQGDSLRRPLAIWWILGIGTAFFVATRFAEFGIAPAWLALAAALTALPFGGGAVGPAVSRRRLGLARRLARRVGTLAPRAGTDDRLQQRVAALWQHSRRLKGRELEQVRELGIWCREHGWPQAAAFYDDQQRGRESDAPTTGVARLIGWLRGRSGAARRPRIEYSATEMRSW